MRRFTTLIARRWRSALAGAAAFVILLGALALTPQVAEAQHGLRYTFVNRTSYTIYNLYMSSSNDRSWRHDRLGSSVLAPGQSFTLSGLRPGYYDIKLIDEDRDECVRMRVPVFRSTRWVITNNMLLRCEGYR